MEIYFGIFVLGFCFGFIMCYIILSKKFYSNERKSVRKHEQAKKFGKCTECGHYHGHFCNAGNICYEGELWVPND
jgi:hypothetical protein